MLAQAVRKDLCLLVLPRVFLVFHLELEAFTCWQVFCSLPGLGDEKGSLEKARGLLQVCVPTLRLAPVAVFTNIF